MKFETGAAERSSPLEDDLVMWKLLCDKPKLRRLERDLFSTKWFDYRLMSPLQATRLYVRIYGDVYREIFATHRSIEAAPHIRVLDLDRLLDGLRRDDPDQKGIFTACWRGRQHADVLGMPYREYLSLAFDFRLRFWQQSKLPRPQHLYDERDIEKIQARWEEMQEGKVYVSDHPAYTVQNYVGADYQNDHHEWLFVQANKRVDSHFYLARFIEAGLLPIDKVESRLGEEQFAWVREKLA